jgi:hypothetical protein
MKLAKKYYVIVCDDIRTEQEGKLSLMGVIPGDLIVNEIPCIVPNLSIIIVFEGVNFNELKSSKIMVKGPTKKDQQTMLFDPPEQKTDKINGAKMIITMSPFRIKKEGKVKVQILTQNAKKAKTLHQFKIINKSALD